MDTGFKITGPGEYRMRNGERATVQSMNAPSFTVGDHFRIFGSAEGSNHWWEENGRNAIGAALFDIIGPWIGPFTITEPGNYVTRNKLKAVIIAVDVPGNRPLLGYVQRENGAINIPSHAWMKDGSSSCSAQGHLDIVGKWVEPVMIERDIDVYVDGFVLCPYSSTMSHFETQIASRRIRWDGVKIIDVTDKT